MLIESPWRNQKPQYGTPIDRRHPLGADLGCWVFNEDAGLTAFDLSANNPAVLAGTAQAWGVDQFGGSAGQCDGTDNYWSIGKPTSLQFTSLTPFSLGGWVYPRGVGFFGRLYAGDVGGGRNGMRIDLETGPVWSAELDGASVTGTTVQSAATLNVWQHVFATYDTTTLTLYVNGVAAGSTRGVGTGQTYSSLTAFGWGGRPTGPGNFLNCFLGMCSIYGRCLEREEVARLYNDPFCMFEPRRVWVPEASAAGSVVSQTWRVPHESLVSATKTVTIPSESLTSINRVARLPSESLASAAAVESIPAEWIATISRACSLPLDWPRAIAGTGLMPLELVASVQATKSIAIDWATHITQTNEVPFESLGTAVTRAAACCEWLSQQSGGLISPMEWQATLQAAGIVPVEWGGLTPQPSRIWIANARGTVWIASKLGRLYR